MPIIVPIPRGERRLMQKAIHKTRDKNHARRLTAMLMLHRGERVSDVARTLCCARSSVGRWINWFTHSGIEGLKSLPAGRSRRCPSDVEHRQIKYRNNVIECDHGKLKRIIGATLGFKSMKTAYATIKGIEVMRALRKGQASAFYYGDPLGEMRLVSRVFEM
ncbi:DDE domain-containing protein [Salmonella enterica subsp. enterica serovar Braenderup]|uniref:DDE domain-containing protein n=3 Tax=Enterobacteriaceae TaxID=543 RepID=A0A5X8N5G7_SALET|nr:hypothetical protein [Salmonella enterica subsp. enterica serovar Typhimurium]EAO1313499.1 DDE domain-containing protein [Salmonella enterica]EBZ5739162.1 DDE domain-containing protein [Salmonella enterica subsp. enterica serovar Braenderup]EFH8082620.1 DDE-type integrase/transposase/recombinase [Escherichia coli]EBH5755953.1 DDE-type integrase/transposase/recombinase [Salmonella enterica]